MKTSILKSSFAGIAATLVAVSFGYLAVQYFGKYIMLAIGTGMLGLGAAVHRTQQSLHQPSLPERLEVTEFKPNRAELEKEVIGLYDTRKKEVAEAKANDISTNKSVTTASGDSITVASKSVRSEASITKVASTSPSSGYCRKRLALCHKAKLESSKKASPKN